MNDMTSVCSVQTEDCDEEFWMTEVVLKVGEPAPDFALKDDHGCVRTLKDFQGRKLILYIRKTKRLDAPSRLRDFVITLKTLREPDGRWSASPTTMWRRTAGSVIITA